MCQCVPSAVMPLLFSDNATITALKCSDATITQAPFDLT